MRGKRGLREEATVLVAEENDAMRDLIVRTLERKGYRAIQARDGDEALRLAVRERPDLILMDVALPLRDGYAVARALAREPGAAGIPIIPFEPPAARRRAGKNGERSLRAFDERRLLKQMDRALSARRVTAGGRAGLWT